MISAFLNVLIYVAITFGVGFVGLRGGAAQFRYSVPAYMFIILGVVLICAALGRYTTAAYDLAGSIEGLYDPFIHEIVMETAIAKSATAFIAAGLMVFVSYRLPIAGLGALIAVLYAISAIGHTTPLGWTGQVLVMLHSAIIIFWAGGLAILACAGSTNRPVMALYFRKLAIWLVPIGLVSGIVLAYFLVGSYSSLFSTEYGLALLAKAGVVGLVLSIAALNHQKLTGLALEGNQRPLLTAVMIEGSLIFAVLVLTAYLTRQSPPLMSLG